jgi:hypothetical protein
VEELEDDDDDSLDDDEDWYAVEELEELDEDEPVGGVPSVY